MTALLSLLLVLVLPALAALVALSDVPGQASAADDAPDDTDDTDVTDDADVTGVTGERTPTTWDLALARALAWGLAAWLLGSGLLTRTVGLTATSAWVWDAAVAAVSLVVLLLPRQRARFGGVLRPALGRLAGSAGLTVLVFLPLVLVILRTSWSPFGSTPWYYYGLARQVAEAGSIPPMSVEFTASTPFLNDYHLFTTGTAMLLVQHPGGPITVITIVTLLGALLLGVGMVALATALGADRFAALLAVPVALATGIGMMRLSAYRPEGFALGLVVLVAALSLDWFHRGDRRSLLAGGLLVATLSQVHGIAAVTAGVMVVAAALAHLVRGPRGELLRRAGIALGCYAVAVVIIGLAFHEASGTAHAGGLVDQGGLDDPTWEFYRAARGYFPSPPPSNGRMLFNVPGYLYGRSWWWVATALLLAGLGLWLRRRDRDSRLVVVFTALTLVGLALVASVFMLGWQGYVPRRTGASRIPLDASLLVPPFVAVGLGCLARQRWRWRGRTVPERRRRPILLVALVLCGLVTLVDVARYDSTQALTRDDLAVWRSLPLERGDVVLANGYTEGFIPDVSHAQGLLDGRAPYTFDGLLHRANSLFRNAHDFFVDPAHHWSFLRQHHVTWVVIGDPGTYALSTGNTWYVPQDLDVLERCHGLRLVVDNPRLTVFRVVDPSPAGCTPSY
jgi:hypothetical protein